MFDLSDTDLSELDFIDNENTLFVINLFKV